MAENPVVGVKVAEMLFAIGTMFALSGIEFTFCSAITVTLSLPLSTMYALPDAPGAIAIEITTTATGEVKLAVPEGVLVGPSITVPPTLPT